MFLCVVEHQRCDALIQNLGPAVSDGQEPLLFDGEATFLSFFDFRSFGAVTPIERT